MVVLRGGRKGGREEAAVDAAAAAPPPMSFSEPPVLLPLSRESHQHSLSRQQSVQSRSETIQG